jgi:hypothetical protein
VVEKFVLRKAFVPNIEVAENCTVRRFIIWAFYQIVTDKIKERGIGGAYRRTKRRKEMCLHNLVKTPEVKRTLEKPKHNWKHNIKMDHKNSTGYHRLHSCGSCGKKCLTFANMVMNTKLHTMRDF